MPNIRELSRKELYLIFKTDQAVRLVEELIYAINNTIPADVTVVEAALAAHIADTSDAHAASAIGNTPAGTIAATTVQGAINELDTEKAPLASPTFTGTPAAPTAAPGTNTTQISTTAFVMAAISLAVTGLLDLKGDTDASANPNYPAASKGDAYYITVAGKIGGASGKSVEVGDVYIAKADNAGGTEAAVGTSWFVLEHNLAGALLAANNLSDLTNAGTARGNLGLGSIATQAASNVSITGGTIALASGSLGYAAGNGGTVTQNTDKSTTVVLNEPSGEITMDNDALAADTAVTFTLTNSTIATTDRLILNHISGGTFMAYSLDAQPGAGSALIGVRNLTAGPLSEAIVIGFTVVKSANA